MTFSPSARAATIATSIVAVVAALFVWTAAPVLAACPPSVARTAHVTWTLTRDATSCATSGNQDRIGETFERIAPLGSQLVAIGQVAQDPVTSQPRDWASFTSAAGATWDEHSLPFARSQLDEGFALAGGAGRVVIVGAGFAGTSTDGVAWQVASTPPPASVRVTAVAFGNTAAAATRRWLAAGQSTRTASRLALWLSADGLAWTRVPDRTVFGRFCATAVAASARGYVVVGSDCTGRPAALSSPDGRTWRRAPAQAAFARNGIVRDVIASSAGFIAAGDDRSSTGARGTAFWCSTHGLSWRRAAFFSAPKGGETFVTLVRTSAGYFGISDTGFITDGLPPGSFYSPTGAIWRRDGLLPNAGYGSEDGDWMTDATAVGTRIVAVGRYNDPDPGGYHAGGLITVGTAHR